MRQSQLEVMRIDIDEHEECDGCTVYWDGDAPVAVDLCEDHASTSEKTEQSESESDT